MPTGTCLLSWNTAQTHWSYKAPPALNTWYHHSTGTFTSVYTGSLLFLHKLLFYSHKLTNSSYSEHWLYCYGSRLWSQMATPALVLRLFHVDSYFYKTHFNIMLPSLQTFYTYLSHLKPTIKVPDIPSTHIPCYLDLKFTFTLPCACVWIEQSAFLNN